MAGKQADPLDNSLVWATHDGIELAALVGRRFLAAQPDGGWHEVADSNPKVKAAQKQHPSIERPQPPVAEAEPAQAKGQTSKEKA